MSESYVITNDITLFLKRHQINFFLQILRVELYLVKRFPLSKISKRIQPFNFKRKLRSLERNAKSRETGDLHKEILQSETAEWGYLSPRAEKLME